MNYYNHKNAAIIFFTTPDLGTISAQSLDEVFTAVLFTPDLDLVYLHCMLIAIFIIT